MNKNSKQRQLLIRKQAKENRPTNEGGKMVISCNAPPKGKRVVGGCQRVYINQGADGKKHSITRHEPISSEVKWTDCTRKVGARSKGAGKVNA